MRVQVIRDINHLPIKGKEWNELVSQSQTNTPFQTFEWFKSWWKIFGKQHQMFLLLFYEGENLTALAPLMIKNNKQKKNLTFISDVNADYCDFIVGKGDKESLLKFILEYLLQNKNQWDSIFLRNIPECSDTTSLLKSFCFKNNLLFVEEAVHCPVLITRNLKDTEIIGSSRTLRRHLNYFDKNGGLDFKIFDSLDEAEASLDLFFEQHIRRWDFVNKSSLFCDNRYKEFYRELLQEAWQSGWLFFSCLQFNEHPIAFHYGMDHNSRVIWYKPSFNIDFRTRSPGRILLKYLIEYCVENNKIEFDFTLGDETFKREYTNTVRNNYNIQIFKNKTDYFFEIFKKKSIGMAKKILHTTAVRL